MISLQPKHLKILQTSTTQHSNLYICPMFYILHIFYMVSTLFKSLSETLLTSESHHAFKNLALTKNLNEKICMHVLLLLSFWNSFLNEKTIYFSVKLHFKMSSTYLFVCVSTAWKLYKYGVFSGPYFTVFWLNTEIYRLNLRIQSKYGKIQTRKNSVFGHFSRSKRQSYLALVSIYFVFCHINNSFYFVGWLVWLLCDFTTAFFLDLAYKSS